MLQSAQAEQLFFNDDSVIPNSRFPVLIYRRAIEFRGMNLREAEERIDERLSATAWRRDWTGSILGKAHYHSTTHAALVICDDNVIIRLGGPRVGKAVHLYPGDAIVIPAGVAYESIKKPKTLKVFGLYPVEAKPYDVLHCRKGDRKVAFPNLALLNEPPPLGFQS